MPAHFEIKINNAFQILWPHGFTPVTVRSLQ